MPFPSVLIGVTQQPCLEEYNYTHSFVQSKHQGKGICPSSCREFLVIPKPKLWCHFLVYQICKCDWPFLWSHRPSCFLNPTILPLVNGFPVCIHQFLMQLSRSFLLMWPQFCLYQFQYFVLLNSFHRESEMQSDKHRCPLPIMLQISVLRTLSLPLDFSVARLTGYSTNFSALTFYHSFTEKSLVSPW